MKNVSIIILNWNGKELTRACLNSIKKNTDYPTYEIIVVDNGSADGSVEMLEKEFPAVRLVKNDRNLGFASGMNQGMKVGTGDYFFLLSNDTLVTDGWLTNAVSVLQSDEKISSVGCLLIGKYERNKINSIKIYEVDKDTVCGAAMLIRREAVETIGFFDAANFSPIYGEETDWNYRAKNAGYRVVETSKCKIVHVGSVSAINLLGYKKQYLMMNTNRLKAMLFNDSIFRFLKRIPGLGLIFVRSFREGMTLILLQSYWDNIRAWRTILKERKKRTKVLDKLKRSI